ncbi:UNVERIFIED_CONTAM: hypothetical protein FKN15_001500 [Acipenser sinensis]
MVLVTEEQENYEGQLCTPVDEIKPLRSSSKKEPRGVTFHSETENGGEEKHKKAGKPFNEQLQPLNIDAELFQTRKKSPLVSSETENGGEEKHKKAGKPFNEQLQPLNIDAELFQTRKKSPLVRSKTFDTNVSQISSECETKLERKKSSTSQFTKTNAQFHKLFKEVCKDELLKQSYTCALQKDILYQGKLFVSENWICFHSKVFGKDTRIVIPVSSVTLIKKTKTAILVPNALVIATPNDRHVFGSLLSRDATYKVLKSICVHLEDFAADFSDLDGAVRKRRQEMEETTSSGSQTPEYESIPVLSSCYMGFKIMALEQRLTSLGSLTEYRENELFVQRRSESNVNAEMIHGELTSNLAKLEQIKKNLQRLLDETE